MSHLSWSPVVAAALLLSACATRPEPVVYGRDETGVVVAVRPIVVAQADVIETPAATLPGPAPTRAAAGAVTRATPEPQVRVLVVADAVRPGETQRGVSYTIRRDRDGTLFEVSQPDAQGLAAGTRVNIGYTDRVRITPVS